MVLVNGYSEFPIAHDDGEDSRFAPDHKEIRDFTQWLHQLADGLDGELVLVAIEQKPDEARSQVRVERFAVADSVTMARAALEEANKDWVNVYFAAYVVHKGLPPKARGSGDDIAAVLMLGVDQDADTGREGALLHEPDLIVQTSHIPTVNRQAFYVLEPTDRSLVAEAYAVGEALRHATGADSGTGDIARVFRLPGTLNWPTPTKIRRGRPLAPQVTVIEKKFSGYTALATLRDKLGRATSRPTSATLQDPKVLLKRASATLKKKLQAHDKAGDRSSAAYAAIMMVLREGFSDDEIQALVEAHPHGVGERYAGSKGLNLAHDIRRIREKWQKETNECDQLLKSGQEVGLPSGFAHEPDGDLVRVDRANGERHKVCSSIEVTAKIRDKESAGWGLVVRLVDPDGQQKQIIVPWRDLNVTSGERDPVGKLRDQGLQLYSTGAASEIRDFLTRSHPAAIARSIDRTGWQGDAAFALPGRIIGAPNEPLVWAGEQSDAEIYRGTRTLADWRASIAQPAADHPLLVAALCHGLVGPILELCDADGFGIHLFGKSSSGKTTAAVITASIWGPPERFVRSWRTTVNGLEGVAAAQNEVLLVLDELKQASPDDIAQALYMISQGRGKQRAGRSGQARSAKTWNVPYISTGEISTQTYVNSAFGNKATAGQQVRCLDIRVPADTGIFREGSEPQENSALATHLKAVANDCHGTAGPAFLERIVKGKDAAKMAVCTLRKEFGADPCIQELLASKPDGQVLRVLDQISILYATGCLASTLSVFDFSGVQVRNAALLILELWLKERGGVEAHEDQEAVETIRGFIQVNQFRFITIADEEEAYRRSAPTKPVGYHLVKDRIFAIYPTVWKQEACLGLDEKQVAAKLVALGHLQAEMSKGRIKKVAKKVTVDGDRQRLVCISAEILSAGGVDRQSNGTIQRFVA